MEGYTNFTKLYAPTIKADAFVGPVTGNVTGSASKLNYITSAGVTITALTAAIGNPATIADGTLFYIKDTADSNKIKVVVVIGGAFYNSGAYTAAV